MPRDYDAAVTKPRRLAATAFLSSLVVTLACLAVACSATPPTPAPSIARSAAPRSPAATLTPSRRPSLSPVPGAPSPTPAPTRPGTTKTEFGVIWDALPPSWPRLPGQSQSEVGSDASEMLVVKGKPVALARLLEMALEAKGWSVDVGSPLEDGSVVLDATGPTKGCKAHVVIGENSPGSNDGTALVYYGAGCPFP